MRDCAARDSQPVVGVVVSGGERIELGLVACEIVGMRVGVRAGSGANLFRHAIQRVIGVSRSSGRLSHAGQVPDGIQTCVIGERVGGELDPAAFVGEVRRPPSRLIVGHIESGSVGVRITLA